MNATVPVITALYAGILGLMSIGIAGIAGRLRGQTKISIGSGGNQEMLLAMRRHSNFIETVPLALILIAVLEMASAPILAIHGFGIALVVFRLCHAFGLKPDTIQGAGRVIGAGGSALLVLVTSIWAIVIFLTPAA